MSENTNTERDLMQLGCYLEDRGGVWVVQYAEGGCMPASITEKRLWNALQEARASLSLPAAGQEPVADRAFLERTLSAMEGVIDVADRKTVEFDALRSCVIDLTLMLFKAAPQPAVAAGWVSVDDRLPEPDEPVLAHNGKWTGVAAWMSGEYLEPLERWQDEHREFIEMMGPEVTHWMPLPPAPSTEGESNG